MFWFLGLQAVDNGIEIRPRQSSRESDCRWDVWREEFRHNWTYVNLWYFCLVATKMPNRNNLRVFQIPGFRVISVCPREGMAWDQETVMLTKRQPISRAHRWKPGYYFKSTYSHLPASTPRAWWPSRKGCKLGNKHLNQACGEQLRYNPWQRAQEVLSCHLPVVFRLFSA